MVNFSTPHEATAGDAILASNHNANWNYLKQWLEGVVGQESTYPGVIQKAGGAITGNLTVSGSTSTGTLTSTGTSSFGTVTGNAGAMYLNSSQHDVVGLSAGENINGETAGNWLLDHQYRAGFTASGPGTNTHALSYPTDVASGAFAGNYDTEKHRYSVYSNRAGEGYAGAAEARPESEYRLVINGSMAIRGDIIGYSNKNESVPGTSSDYGLGLGTRIDCQWLNVGANVDIAGELRVQTAFDYARIYMGNDYYTAEDYIEWKDTLPTTNLPGFQFVHNSTAHLTIAESSGVLDLRSQSGWPTLSGTQAVITTTGSHQLGLSSSSIRFKEDVEDLETEDTWTKLKALKPRSFRWNEQVATKSGLDYETQTPELGFIAEEVHEAAPDATMYDENGDPIVYRDKSMLAMLVKAVQDLDGRLGELE
ncbi:MAG: tail fiber domain-containing protein [Pirellulales bacterium]|nr:tail fiber domain-containing protein [Pirellulales bacterium]